MQYAVKMNAGGFVKSFDDVGLDLARTLMQIEQRIVSMTIWIDREPKMIKCGRVLKLSTG